MVEFKIVDHETRGVKVVEVWVDDKFKAVIYPEPDLGGIRIISTHMKDQDGMVVLEFKL